jgi:predicted metal-dependent hydrolase
LREQRDYQIEDLQFKIVYSRRRTIGISVLPDSSVIVRVPYLTSLKTISRIVTDKYDWVLKHRDNYRSLDNTSLKNTYKSGEMHLYHGHEYILKIEYSTKPYFRTEEPFLLIGTDKTEDSVTIKKLMYKGYREEAASYFPALMTKVLNDHQDQGFKPAGLIIRTMKRRWGSCSNKGMITLSTELIKLSDLYIEYVISHELCHLKHHNHGPNYYKLLSVVFPDWKAARKELRKYIQ